MMRDNNRMELTMNEMDQVAGGYIVDCGMFENYLIVDDHNGDVLDSVFFIFQAEDAASKKGVKKLVITEEKYREMFGK